MIVGALRLCHEFAHLIHEVESHESFYAVEIKWRRNCRTDAIDGYFGVSIAFVSRQTLSYD
jgi:hypothetical protein